MKIQLATTADMAAFKPYLQVQMKENGDGVTPLYMPLSREQCAGPIDIEGRFTTCLSLPLTDLKWRRLWLLWDEAGDLLGHIDLRSLGEAHTTHRALLGMGLSLECRGKGIGGKLIDHVVAWARENGLEYIDLDVMSTNPAGIKLYQKCGFVEVGRVNDKYRVDGQMVDEIQMSLPL